MSIVQNVSLCAFSGRRNAILKNRRATTNQQQSVVSSVIYTMWLANKIHKQNHQKPPYCTMICGCNDLTWALCRDLRDSVVCNLHSQPLWDSFDGPKKAKKNRSWGSDAFFLWAPLKKAESFRRTKTGVIFFSGETNWSSKRSLIGRWKFGLITAFGTGLTVPERPRQALRVQRRKRSRSTSASCGGSERKTQRKEWSLWVYCKWVSFKTPKRTSLAAANWAARQLQRLHIGTWHASSSIRRQ